MFDCPTLKIIPSNSKSLKIYIKLYKVMIFMWLKYQIRQLFIVILVIKKFLLISILKNSADTVVSEIVKILKEIIIFKNKK